MSALQVVGGTSGEALPLYPYGSEDRLDSHFFVAWERRRWLNSGMRLQGTPECRAYYCDLIWISFDQSPVGTLPLEPAILAKLAMVDRDHFEALCKLSYGPLHNWVQVQCEDGEIRLMHEHVLRTINEAMSRREDNRARNEAGNAAKRLQRLRKTIAGYDAKLVDNDAAVRWIDEYLVKQGIAYRGASVIEDALRAWANHMFDLGKSRR